MNMTSPVDEQDEDVVWVPSEATCDDVATLAREWLDRNYTPKFQEHFVVAWHTEFRDYWRLTERERALLDGRYATDVDDSERAPREREKSADKITRAYLEAEDETR